MRKAAPPLALSDIEGKENAKVTVMQDQLQSGSGMANGISKGWPLVLPNMTSFLETGTVMDLLAPPRQLKETAMRKSHVGFRPEVPF